MYNNNNISAFMMHLGQLSSEIISYNTDAEGKRQEGGQSYYVEHTSTQCRMYPRSCQHQRNEEFQ